MDRLLFHKVWRTRVFVSIHFILEKKMATCQFTVFNSTPLKEWGEKCWVPQMAIRRYNLGQSLLQVIASAGLSVNVLTSPQLAHHSVSRCNFQVVHFERLQKLSDAALPQPTWGKVSGEAGSDAVRQSDNHNEACSYSSQELRAYHHLLWSMQLLSTYHLICFIILHQRFVVEHLDWGQAALSKVELLVLTAV